MKLIKEYARHVYHSSRHLVIHVFFLISILYLADESNHESTLFANIVRVSRLQTRGTHDTVFVRHLMKSMHKMMNDRNAIFNNTEQLSFKARLFQSVDSDLMYGAGACGGFSKVFARALKTAGYTTRIGQMKVNGVYGGHILLETYLPSLHNWVVMDPLFLQVFTNPKGIWASFDEVSQDWLYYRQQITDKKYNDAYRYEGIRYTNWSKFPFTGNAIYLLLSFVNGSEWADHFSIRPYLLDRYRFAKWVLLLSYGWYILLGMFLLNRKERSA